MLRDFNWFPAVNTRPTKAATQVELDDLGKTMATVCEYHATDPDIAEVTTSWDQILNWIAEPPPIEESKTWARFSETFHMDSKVINRTCKPSEDGDEPVSPPPADVDEHREAMAGVEADVAGERLAELDRRQKEILDLNRNKYPVELAYHPEDAVGHGPRKARVRALNFEKGKLYVMLIDGTPGWAIVKFLGMIREDWCRIWYWGNLTIDHTGPIWGQVDTIDGYKNTKANIELKCLSSIECVLTDKKRIPSGVRKLANEAAARHLLGEAPLERKATSKGGKRR